MEVLSNIHLLQHLTKPKANSKATITSKSQGNGGGANNNKSNSSADTSNTNNATNTSTPSWSTSPPETWTAEDDAILHDLKPKNTSWKAILIALGDGHTSESQAKARWKEIEGKPVAGAGSDGGGTDKKDEDKKAKADKARADGLAKQAAGKGKGKGGGSDSGQQMGKKGILKVPPLLSFHSLPYLPYIHLLTHPPTTGWHLHHHQHRLPREGRQVRRREIRLRQMAFSRVPAFRPHRPTDQSRDGEGHVQGDGLEDQSPQAYGMREFVGGEGVEK
jgi:hypothetical protein